MQELVKRAQENIDAYNAKLNAVNHVQANKALKDAQQFDKKVKTLSKDDINALPPFFGIPILLIVVGRTSVSEFSFKMNLMLILPIRLVHPLIIQSMQVGLQHH